jgi:branched-chain amino acid transport system substrate-binding protein
VGRGAARVAAAVLAAVLASFALGGCGGKSSPPGNRIRGRLLTIWVSVPLHGRSAVSGQAVVRGATLALGRIGGRIGQYRIALRAADDSTPTGGRWDAGQTTLVANQAIADPTTIGYVGDLDSGASAVSIPLLNRLGIAQVAPGGTAVGLTSGASGADPGEPEKYYPTGKRTFARVIPNDLVQAAVQVTLMKRRRCHAVYVFDDGEVDGADTANTFVEVAHERGLRVVDDQSHPYDPTATDYTALGQAVAQSGADCVLIAAIADANAVALTTQVGAAVPKARLFGTSGVAESTFTDPLEGGIPSRLDGRMLITAMAGDPAAGTPAAALYAAYTKRYGTPEPAALGGYEAMALMLDAVARATAGGTRAAERSKVVAALFRTRDRPSVLGTYSIDPHGDTTLGRFGVYRVADGELRYVGSVAG